MHHEVHKRKANHGAVDIVAEECLAENGFRLFGKARRNGCSEKSVFVRHEILVSGTNCQLCYDVLIGSKQESACATCRIGNGMAKLWFDQIGHHFDNVARGTKLPVFTGGGNFGEQEFIDVTLNILKCLPFFIRVFFHHLKDLVNRFHGFNEKRWLGNDEDRIFHVVAEL